MYVKVIFEDHLMDNPPETIDNTTHLINCRHIKHGIKTTDTTVLHVERCYVPLEER